MEKVSRPFLMKFVEFAILLLLVTEAVQVSYAGNVCTDCCTVGDYIGNCIIQSYGAISFNGSKQSSPCTYTITGCGVHHGMAGMEYDISWPGLPQGVTVVGSSLTCYSSTRMCGSSSSSSSSSSTTTTSTTSTTTVTLVAYARVGLTHTGLAKSVSTVTGQQIYFDCAYSHASSGHSISSCQWNYGDGSSGQSLLDAQAQHSFTVAGTYYPILTVVEDTGNQATDTVTVVIATTTTTTTTTTTPLVARAKIGLSSVSLGSSVNAHPGDTIYFDCSGSTGNTISSYKWDYGDGVSSSFTSPSQKTHIYTNPGSYSPKLTVYETTGNEATATVSASIATTTSSSSSSSSTFYTSTSSSSSSSTSHTSTSSSSSSSTSHTSTSSSSSSSTSHTSTSSSSSSSTSHTSTSSSSSSSTSHTSTSSSSSSSTSHTSTSSSSSSSTSYTSTSSSSTATNTPTSSPTTTSTSSTTTLPDANAVAVALVRIQGGSPAKTVTASTGEDIYVSVYQSKGSVSGGVQNTVTQWTWNYGDGATDTFTNPSEHSHKYASPGTYTIELRITDTAGAQASDTATAIIISTSSTASQSSTTAPSTTPFPAATTTPGSGGLSSSSTYVSTTTKTTTTSNQVVTTTSVPTTLYIPTTTVVPTTLWGGERNAVQIEIPTTATHSQEKSTTTVTSQPDKITTTTLDTRLIVEAGGPYTGEVGESLLFKGNSSLKDEYVSAYRWDYGDGSQGDGKESKHAYLRPGLYNVTLAAKDIDGRTDSRSAVAYVHTVELSVDIGTAPPGQKYTYGDSQESLQVNVSYPDKRKFESIQIYGELSGSKKVNTSFEKKADGTFEATVNYPIMKDDGLFLDVYVNATDKFYNSGVDFERLLLASSDPGIDLEIVKPASRIYAPGQVLHFEVRFLGPESGGIEKGNVTLYEGWTKTSIPFVPSDGLYTMDYRMPGDAKPQVHLFVYGQGSSGSKEYHAVKDLELRVIRKLGLGLMYPTPADQSQGLDMIKLNITYPDGEPFAGDRVSALVDNRSVVFERKDGLFYGSYNIKRDKPDLKIKVWDGYGNAGESDFTVFDDRILNGLELGALVVMGLFFLAALFFGFSGSSFYSRRRKSNDKLRSEYDELNENIVALKKLMEDIKNEYYTRKISAEDANQRLLDYQEELKAETSKLRKVLEDMGLDKKDVEGHEELIRWIVEKLEARENIEKIRRVIVDSGVDTSIVERVRKVFTVH